MSAINAYLNTAESVRSSMEADKPGMPLAAGYEGGVVRFGSTVRKPPHRSRFGYIRALLVHLGTQGYDGAPRFLGLAEDGREILSYIPGLSGNQVHDPRDIESDDAIVGVARLLRDLHDLTADTEFAADGEVACHADLHPANTIYEPGQAGRLAPVAFIDWTSARAGTRVSDLAQAAWHYTAVARRGSPEEAGRQIRLLCDSYGGVDRPTVVEQMVWRQQAIGNYLEDHVRQRGPRAARMIAEGLVDTTRSTIEWTERNRAALIA